MNPEELKNIDLEQLIIDDLIKQLKQTHQEQLTSILMHPDAYKVLPHGQENKMTEKEHLECEIEELKIEMQRHMDALKNCTKLIKKNNEKLRKLKMEKKSNSTEMTIDEMVEMSYRQAGYDEETIQKRKANNWRVEVQNANYPMLEVIDENTVRIEGVKYQKVDEVKPLPKPPTLYDALAPQMNTVGFHFNEQQREWICDTVRGWLIDHTLIETEDEDMVTFTIHKEQLQTPK